MKKILLYLSLFLAFFAKGQFMVDPFTAFPTGELPPTVFVFLVNGQSQSIGVSASATGAAASDTLVWQLGDSISIDPERPDAEINVMNLKQAVENNVENGFDVQTIGVAMGRDFLNKFGGDTTIHRAIVCIIGKAVQNNEKLIRGGESGVYEKTITAAERIKHLVDSIGGYQLVFNYVWYHGGTISYRYNTLSRVLYQDLLLDLPTNNGFNFFYSQIRQRPFVGSSWYEASAWSARPILDDDLHRKIDIHYIGRDYDVFRADNRFMMSHIGESVELVDGVHPSGDGQRHHAALFAEAAYRRARFQSVEPLYVSTVGWDHSDSSFYASISGQNGLTLQGSGDYGISVYNYTEGEEEGVDVAIVNNGLVQVQLDTPSVGWQDLIIYSNFSEDIGTDNNRYPWSSLDDTHLGEMHVNYVPDSASIFDNPDTGQPYELTKYLSRSSHFKRIEIIKGDSALDGQVSIYYGSKSVDLILEQDGTEKTAYVVGYTTEDAGRSAATVISDASGAGGAFRAVINNTGDVSNDQEVTLTNGVSSQTIAENTVYWVHVVVQDNTPTTIDEAYRSIHTHIRQEDIIYASDARGWIKGFKLYVPEGYWKRRDPTEEWGWKFGLHGNGEKAPTNTPVTGEAYNLSLLTNNYAGEVSGGKDYDHIIISPQWHEDVPNRDEMYHILVNEVEHHRGFVLKKGGQFFGLSGGGGIGYAFAQKYPERVATIVSSAAFTRWGGSGDGNKEWVDDVDDLYTKAKWYWDIPIVGQHNVNDGTVNYNSTVEVIDAVNALTGLIEAPIDAVGIYPATGGHSGWAAIVAHTADWSSVPNAADEEEFYEYHLTNTYDFHDRISNAVVVAEWSQLQEDKTRAQNIITRNRELMHPDSLTNFQLRLDAVVPIPYITVAPDSIDFADREVSAGPSAASDIVITSDSTGFLDIASITLSTNPSSVFAITAGGTPPDPLAPGETHTVSLTFDPAAETTYEGVLRIISNDATGNDTLDIDIDGTGVAAVKPAFIVNYARFGTSDYGGDVSTVGGLYINQLYSSSATGGQSVSDLVSTAGDTYTGTSCTISAYNSTTTFDVYTSNGGVEGDVEYLGRDELLRSIALNRFNTSEPSVSFTFAGLDNGTYTVRVTGFDVGSRGISDVTVTGSAGTDSFDPDQVGGSIAATNALAAEITGVTVSDGSLVITATSTGSGGNLSGVSAIYIELE